MVGFIFGGNTGVSYKDLQDKRTRADLLAAQILGRQPKTVAEGIGSVLGGIGVGINRWQANKGMREGQQQASSQFDSILSKITGQPSTGGSTLPMPGAAAEIGATAPADVSKNGSTFSPFIDSVKAGGLTNPYGLAAVAATGRAESGWSPENAGRTWNDPSESGQPGTSGGILSLRGPRLAALQAYARSKGEQGNGSPQTQGEFFLREDPQLVAKLNSAQSVEEAQSLMNNAWKFAGYNRPGGEAGRRQSYAAGYLPQFQGGQGGGTEVASLDPSAGMSGAAAIERQAPGSGYVDPTVSAPNSQPQPMQPPIPQARPEQPFDVSRFGPEQPQKGGRLPMPAAVPPQAGGGALPASNVAAAPQVTSAPQQAAPAPQQAAPAPQPPMMQPPQMPQMQPFQIDQETLRFLSSPFADEGQKQAVRMAVQQRQEQYEQRQKQAMWQYQQDYERYQKQSDPAYQLGLKQTQTQIDRMNQPGYRMLTSDERRAYGIPEYDRRPYQISREGQVSAVGGQGAADNPGFEASQREALAARYGIDPKSPEGQRFILTGTLPTSDRGVTAGDREAIRDSEDNAFAAQNVIEQLQSVIAPGPENGPSLNDRAGYGASAGWQSWAARNDPTGFFDDTKGEATTELSNTVLNQALSSLKSIFGAAPTEGERQILLDLQASIDKTPAERKIIIQKAIRQAEKKLAYNQDRAKELRGGTYYKPRQQGGPVNIGGYTIEAE
ncbi:hypothetical protein [Neorhizobium sp. NCHU2750]|uniref:hypothetical protein n=1 Tax=Neorhizobium sp. NCHU2750 TaxID=1825976 RepID=UPI000E768264|nr:hypothetical protein NCHU2750_28070 [Neorhizobium sp. NCHU2750]